MGGAAPRRSGEVDRGPARALRVVGARAGAAAARARRVRRRRPAARARRAVLARQRRVPAVRRHRPDHHVDAAARAVQAGRLPRRVRQPVHDDRHRDALPRGRPAAGRLRHGADDGRDRRPPRARPRRRAGDELHPAVRDAVRPLHDLPGRATPGVRLGRLPGVDGQAHGPRRLGRLRGGPGGSPRGGTAGRHRDRLLRRGDRRRAVRGRPRAGRDERQGRRRHGADHPGAGARDGPRADRRRRARGAVRGRHGDDRRHAPDAVLRRHLRLAGCGGERQRRRARGTGRRGRRRCASPRTRSRRTPTTSSSSTGRCG